MIKLASASYDALDYILNNRLDELQEVVTELEKRAKNITIPDLDEVYTMDPSDFALRIQHSSGDEMRKFAMCTKDLTEINLHLLSNNVDWLPEPIVKTAATNLVRAGLDYKLTIPENLKQYESDSFVNNLVDISNLEKGATFIQEVDEDTFYLLDGKYPADYKEDIEKASRYFDDYHRMFSNEEKTEYATNLVKRAEELKQPVEGLATKYASLDRENLNDEFELKMRERTSYLKDNFHDQNIYLDLIEKSSSLSAEEVLTEVTEADKKANLWPYWGKNIDDPVLTTFSLKKEAQRYVDGRLIKLSDLQGLDDGFLTEVMGSDSIKALKSNEGLDVFETLPSPIKSEIYNVID